MKGGEKSKTPIYKLRKFRSLTNSVQSVALSL